MHSTTTMAVVTMTHRIRAVYQLVSFFFLELIHYKMALWWVAVRAIYF